MTSPPQTRKRRFIRFAIVAVVCLAAFGAFYYYIVSGGLIARQKPSALENFVAGSLIELSIPDAAKKASNPLDNTSAEVDAGRILYQKHCEVCHGYDGAGKTPTSAGLYPPPLSLSRPALGARKRTSGELFYFIRNGIRNTAMPGWWLTDQQTWQIVAYIQNLPRTVRGLEHDRLAQGRFETNAHYVGSLACQKCHSAVYESWRKTLMANVVRDPRAHPEAILPDFSKADPVLTFSTNDIAFVYGSKWKQRYFKRIGGDYYPLPAQWDVTHKIWRKYFAKDDWWAV